MASPTTTPVRRFIKRRDVESTTGLSCTEIYHCIAADTFPSQVTLGTKSAVWIESKALAWCVERVTESREAA